MPPRPSLRALLLPCAAGVALALCGAVPAVAAAQDGGSSITVPGSGEISAAPDTARFSVGVTSEAASAGEAVKANSSAVQRVLEALAAAGVPDKDVQTRSFTVYPVYADRSAETRPRITGYRVTNQVAVEVSGIERVGGVLDRVVAAGANEIGGIAFALADPTKLQDEARRRALADARRRAEVYATAAGRRLGALLRLQEGGARGPGPLPGVRMAEMAAAPPIAGGELDLVVEVEATFALEP
jgi:uncharacterized protein YggE